MLSLITCYLLVLGAETICCNESSWKLLGSLALFCWVFKVANCDLALLALSAGVILPLDITQSVDYELYGCIMCGFQVSD